MVQSHTHTYVCDWCAAAEEVGVEGAEEDAGLREGERAGEGAQVGRVEGGAAAEGVL